MKTTGESSETLPWREVTHCITALYYGVRQFISYCHVGRVLNRFAKDVGFLDDLLPFIFCEYFLVSCSSFCNLSMVHV